MKRKNLILLVFALMSGFTCFSQTNQAPKATQTAQNTDNMAEEIPGPVVEIKTTLGDIVVKLYDDTPLHRDNFLKLVKDGFYEDVLFHRVIKDFMVQTGDPTSKGAAPGEMLGTGNPGYTIEAEIAYPRHYHKYGALAAARTGDAVNPEKRSSGSQFYIVTGRKFNEDQLKNYAMQSVMAQRQAAFGKLSQQYADSIRAMQQSGDNEGLMKLRDKLIAQVESEIPEMPMDEKIAADYSTIGGTPNLDGEYTVFGEVLQGMDVVEKIQNVETDRNDRPVEDIKILSVKVLKE